MKPPKRMYPRGDGQGHHQPFPDYPRGHKIKHQGLEFFGTTITQGGVRWRHVSVRRPDPIPGEKGIGLDEGDMAFLRRHFFPSHLEVVCYVPPMTVDFQKLRMWARLDGKAPYPGKNGAPELKRVIVDGDDD